MSKPYTAISLELARRRYDSLTPAILREWLIDNALAETTVYDPVKMMIENTYGDITVESGVTTVELLYRGSKLTMEEIPIHRWHDELLADVVNRASSPRDYPGYVVDEQEYRATVEALVSYLTPEPLSWFGKVRESVTALFLRTRDTFRSAFAH